MNQLYYFFAVHSVKIYIKPTAWETASVIWDNLKTGIQ